jgi:hypothetical protein
MIFIFLISSFIFALGTRVDLRYDYLHAGIAPRIQALGDTGIISATGPESVYFNPALSIVDTDEYFLAGVTPLDFDQQQYFAYYRLPIAYRNALFSIGFVSHQASNIEVRTYRSDLPDSFMTASDMMLAIGISRYLGPQTSFGMNVAWMMDNYSLAQQTGVNFTFGLAHLFSDEVMTSFLFRHLGDGAFVGGAGIRLDLIDQVTWYTSLDGALGEGFSGFTVHSGVSYTVAQGLDLLFGFDGTNFSCGAKLRLDYMGLQMGYTNTPLGSRYSVGIELLN